MKYNAKKVKRETINTEQKATRTLFISGIKDVEENNEIMNYIKSNTSVKESYTIQNNNSLLFVLFYDIRESERMMEDLNNMGKNVIFTVSKYEIPREVDRCDWNKNQSTILLVSRGLDTPLGEPELKVLFSEFGDIKCIREYKPFQRFLEFYDSRCTKKAFDKLHDKSYKNGTILIRFVWDMTSKQRWDIINDTDLILKSLSIPLTTETDNSAVGHGRNKIYEKNVFLRALDDFIVDNLDEIENF